MRKIRLTAKDIDALNDAVDFISSNTDGAEDRKYYDELVHRVNRVYEALKNRQNRRNKKLGR